MMVKAVLQDCTYFSFTNNDKEMARWKVVRGTFDKNDNTYLCVDNMGRHIRFKCDLIVYRPKTW